ncbi:tyrosine recombinase [Actinomadura luteofluorescens]|uniref:tyrosine recombinase n=1 Tax=Actinomadura luteofluorescens TaxID=46163 RepID=UPI00363B700C
MMGGSPEPTAGRGAALSPSPSSRSTARRPAGDAGAGSALDSAVRTYLGHLAVERGLAANTLSSYRRDLRRYAQVQAGRGREAVGEVTEEDVRAFLVGLREGDEDHPPLSAGSAARALVAVRGLHRFALREGLAAGDPAHDVKPPTPPRRLPKAISLEDVERLLGAAAGPSGDQGTARGLRDRALLELLYGSGARISEAVGLDVDDLDLRDGFARVAGKGARPGSCRSATMPARPWTPTWCGRGPSWPGPGGAGGAVPERARGRLSRQGAWMVLRAAADRAQLSEVSPHTLRHSFATHLLDGGADVRVVQELLGHASVTTTQVYTLVTVQLLREVYATSHPRARN